jgi:hypothetical protein
MRALAEPHRANDCTRDTPATEGPPPNGVQIRECPALTLVIASIQLAGEPERVVRGQPLNRLGATSG